MSTDCGGSDSYAYHPLTPSSSHSSFPLSLSNSLANLINRPDSAAKKSTAPTAKLPKDSLPTPRSSLDNSRDVLLGKIQDAFNKSSAPNLTVTTLSGITPDDFSWLRNQGEKGKIPGWENRRMDYINNQLIITCPTHHHEALGTLIPRLLTEQQLDGHVELGGSANVGLGENLSKFPDQSLYDKRFPEDPEPTVVFEVGVSQGQAALNYNAARILFGTLGQVNAVVNLKIAANLDETKEDLKYVGADVWRMTAEEVEAESMKGLPVKTILTKAGVIAGGNAVERSYRYVLIDGETNPVQYWHLQAKPTHYCLFGTENLFETLPLQPGPIVLTSDDLLRECRPADSQLSLTINTNLLISYIQKGMAKQRRMLVKNSNHARSKHETVGAILRKRKGKETDHSLSDQNLVKGNERGLSEKPSVAKKKRTG